MPTVIDIKEEDDKTDDEYFTKVMPKSPKVTDDTAAGEPNPVDLTCPLCAEQFPDQEDLSLHLRNSHDIGNMYVCNVCHDICWSNKSLIQHMKEHQTKSEGRKRSTGRRKQTPKKVEKGKIKLVLRDSISRLLNPDEEKQDDAKTKAKTSVRKKGVTKKTKSAAKGKKGKTAVSKSVKGKSKVTKEGKVQDELQNDDSETDVNEVNEQDGDLGIDVDLAMVKTEKTVSCSECGKMYGSKRALRRHNAIMHQLKRFMCDTCGRCFTGRDSLNRHIRGLHKMEKVYKCTVPGCSSAFNFNHSLKLHLLKHSGERPHACNICFKTYLTAHHLKVHRLAVHSENKNFVCRFCGKKFSYSTSHKMHEMTHTKDRPFPCNQCDKSFVNGQALKYHTMAKHSKFGSFPCDVCHKVYKTEFLMRAHKKRHDITASTRFMCDVCGGRFMYKSALELHKSVHKDSKDFTCKICGKSFKTYPTLYSHQYVHREDNPYSCATCGKAFKTKERVKAHERRHSGLKPFECTICHRHFPDNGGLQKHLRTVHCSVKKFACDICGKTTSRADNLRVHMKVHTKNVLDDRLGKSVKRGGLPNIFDTDEKKPVKESLKKKKKLPECYGESFSPVESPNTLTSPSPDLYLQNAVNNAYASSNSEGMVTENSPRGNTSFSNMTSEAVDLQNRIPHLIQHQERSNVSNSQPTGADSPGMPPLQIIQTQDSHTNPVPAHNFNLPALQPAAHYMYTTWPYMYQAGIQPNQGGTNSFFQ